MQRPVFTSLFLACLVVSHGVAAAPFGLHPGDKPPTFSILRDNLDGTLAITGVPAAYPGLVQYFARYDAANGLCSVAGATEPFADDAEGVAARLYFARLLERLSAIYGTPASYMFRARGPLPNPGGWVAEITAGLRYHHAFWNLGETRPMVAGVQSIALSIGGNGGSAFVMLQFDFSNYDRCEDARARLDMPAL